MASRTLRAVTADEVVPDAPKPAFSTVLGAAEEGTYLDELVQMRRVIARALDSTATTPTAIAALTLRLTGISKEIEAAKRQQKEEKADAGGTSEDEAWDDEAV